MKINKMLQTLDRAIQSVKMTTASFDDICVHPDTPVKFKDGRAVTEGNVTEFIRERVQLYLSTWVIHRIEMVRIELQSELPHAFVGSRYLCQACGRFAEHRSHKKFKDVLK